MRSLCVCTCTHTHTHTHEHRQDPAQGLIHVRGPHGFLYLLVFSTFSLDLVSAVKKWILSDRATTQEHTQSVEVLKPGLAPVCHTLEAVDHQVATSTSQFYSLSGVRPTCSFLLGYTWKMRTQNACLLF